MPYEDIRDSKEKNKNNAQIVKCIAKYTSGDLKVILLDGVFMNSTRALFDAFGERVKSVIIPETDTMNPKNNRCISPKYRKVLELMDGFCMEAVLYMIPRVPEYNVFYGDYCTQMCGCRKLDRFPLMEMVQFLTHWADKSKPIILACTFQARMRNELANGRKSSKEHMVEDFFKPMLQFNMFKILKLSHRQYSRTNGAMKMVFICAVVVYHPTPAMKRAAKKTGFVLTKCNTLFEGYSLANR